MYRLTSVLVLLLLGQSLWAQQPVFTGTNLNKTTKATSLDEMFKAYQLYEIDTKALNDFVKADEKDKDFQLQLGTAYDWDIHLYPYDIRTPEYQLRVSTENGIIALPKGKSKTFRGYFQDGSGEVRLTIDEGFINGFFHKEGATIFIESANRFEPGLGNDVFVVYDEKDVIPSENNECAVLEAEGFGKKNIPDDHDHEKVVGECYTVEIALASDFSMFNQFGTVAGTESATLAVLNNVQTNYDDDFDDEVQFFVSSQFVSSCFSCDPAVWSNSTDPFVLLPNFRTWGNSGGFGGASFDVASLWTNRNFDGSTIGLAYVGVICSNSRYNVLEHYTGNAPSLRVLQAHELGHNFDADHTNFNGNTTIMAPFINITNDWAPISVTEISNHIAAVANFGNCLSDCGAVGQPPIAGFGANDQVGCAPFTVSFSDQSFGTVESYAWSFPGGNPATSTSPNPVVVYNTPGIYDVSLEVSNAAGVNTLTQPGYITVLSPPVPQFMTNVMGTTVSFINQTTGADNQIWDFGDGQTSLEENPVHVYAMDGIYTVTLTVSNICGNFSISQQVVVVTPPIAGFSADQTSGCTPLEVQFFNESSPNAGDFFWEFEGGNPATSSQQNPLVTYATPGTYSVSLTVSNLAGSNMASQTNYITVNPQPVPDFSFTNVDGSLEVVFTNNSSESTSYSWDFGDGNTSNEENPTHTYDQGGEYTVELTAANACGSETFTEVISLLIAPVAGFSVANTDGCAPYEVQFIDQSTANTTGWSWTFEGGTPATSTDQNPVVTYANPGTFDVSLTVSNAAGENTVLQEDYVTVGLAPTAGFTSNYTLGDTNANFTSTSSNADSYSWDFGDGNSSDEENPGHDFGADGVYTVSLTVTNECGTDTFTEIVTVVTAPSADFEADMTNACLPVEVQFSDLSSANTTGWSWTFEGGTPVTSTDQNPLVTYSVAGTYEVTLEVSNAAGTNTMTLTDYITIIDVPNADFSANAQGLMTTFTNNTTGATSYEWDFGDGNMSTDENPQHTYTADGIYTVSLTAINECGSVTVTEEITVGGLPVASFSSNQSIGCTPFTVEFNDLSSTNTNNWNWTFEGGSPATSTDQNPTVVYNTPGIYDVMLIVSNDLGNDTITETDFIIVGVDATADFDTDVDELTVMFTNNSTNGNTYEWDFGDMNSSNDENPTHTYAAEGTYTVTLTVTNECGSVSTTETIVLLTAPTAGFTSDTEGGCAPVTVQFMDESSDNVESWDWTFEGGNPATSTEENPEVSYSSPGTFSVTLVVSNAVGESTVVQEDFITIDPQPEPDFSFDIDGFTVNFTNASVYGDTYEWVFGDGNMSTEANPNHEYEEDGSYQVTLKVTNECGVNSITKEVIILTLPTPAFSSDMEVGCAPFTVQFFNESSSNTSSIKWTFEGGTPAQTTEENPVVLFDQPGTYSVTLTAINDLGEIDLVEENYITVNDDPVADFNYDVSGFDVSFADNSEDADSYSWDFGDGNMSDEASPNHTYENEGMYTVVLIVSNECGEDSMMIEVLIDADLPIAGFTADQTEACAPFMVQFNNESSENAISYEWTFEGGTPATSTEVNPMVSFNSAGVYTITLVVTNGAGSDALTRFDYIVVEDVPVAEFGYQQDGFTVDFVNVSTLGDNYIWNFGDGEMSTDENPTHVYEPGFMYTAQLIAINQCGTDTAEQVLNFEGVAPTPAITASQTLGCTPFTVEFGDLSEGEPTEWLWSFAGGEPASSTEQNPTVVYSEAGTYPVQLEVSNIFGSMSETFDAYITVEQSPEASFTYTINGLEVSFESTASGENLNYEWFFGDNMMSEEENPVHTYTMPGIYQVLLQVKNDCGTDTVMLEVNLIVDDVESVEWLEEMTVFPNPNDGRFVLEMNGQPVDNLNLRLFNVLGQQFYQEKVDFSTGHLNKEIRLNQLISGLYLLEISAENSSVYRKIIIK
jgi:PKD repeat protein